MGRRSRQRARGGPGGPDGGESARPSAPTSTYEDPQAGVLVLRGSLSPASRRGYAEALAGGAHREDAWQRAAEYLFERLAVSWTLSDVTFERQAELLGRYRMASPEERRFVRDSLRAHVAEHFPELDAP